MVFDMVQELDTLNGVRRGSHWISDQTGTVYRVITLYQNGYVEIEAEKRIRGVRIDLFSSLRELQMAPS